MIDYSTLQKELIVLRNHSSYVFKVRTEDCDFVYCNTTILNFFEIKQKQKYIENITSHLPILYSNDYGLSAVEKLKKCIKPENFYYEFMLHKNDETTLSGYINFQKIKIKDKFFVVNYQFALSSIFLWLPFL